MTPDLDRKVAEAGGMRRMLDDASLWDHAHGFWPKLSPEARMELPAFSSSPAGLSAMLLWAAGKGLGISLNRSTIKRPSGAWYCAIIVTKGDPDGTIVDRFDETADTPSEALALAIVAYHERPRGAERM